MRCLRTSPMHHLTVYHTIIKAVLDEYDSTNMVVLRLFAKKVRPFAEITDILGNDKP